MRVHTGEKPYVCRVSPSHPSLSPTSDSVTLEDHLMGSKGFPTHVGLPIEIWPQGFSWNLNLAANEHIFYASRKRAKRLSFATNWSEQWSSGRRLQPVFCPSWELEDPQSVSKSWKNCYIENRKLISTWLWRHLTKVMLFRFLEYNWQVAHRGEAVPLQVRSSQQLQQGVQQQQRPRKARTDTSGSGRGELIVCLSVSSCWTQDFMFFWLNRIKGMWNPDNEDDMKSKHVSWHLHMICFRSRTSATFPVARSGTQTRAVWGSTWRTTRGRSRTRPRPWWVRFWTFWDKVEIIFSKSSW